MLMLRLEQRKAVSRNEFQYLWQIDVGQKGDRFHVGSVSGEELLTQILTKLYEGVTLTSTTPYCLQAYPSIVEPLFSGFRTLQ